MLIGSEVLPFVRRWLEEHTLYYVVRLFGNGTLVLMFKNAPQPLHAYPSDCAVRAAPNSLRLCVTLACLLFFASVPGWMF